MAYIRVRNKLTGQTGQVPEENFDPNKYEPLEGNKGIVGTLTQPFANTIQRAGGALESVYRLNLADKAEKALQAGNYDEAQRLGQEGGKGSQLTNGGQQKLTDPLQIAKDSAAMLSWGVPIKGATGGQKILSSLKPGAMSGFGYSQETSPEGLLKSTAIGAGTAAATTGVLNKLFPGKTGGEIKTKKINAVQKAGAQEFMQASPRDFAKAAEHKIDVRNVLVDNIKKASEESGKVVVELDDLIGKLDGSSKGMVGKNISEAEKVIQEFASKNAGKKINISGFVDELANLRADLAKSPTNIDSVKQLDKLIKLFKSQYPSGVPTKDVLTILRSANEKFGDSIVNDTVGTVNSQVEKQFANYIRSNIKGNKAVADALRTQEENIILRSILKKTRGVMGTQGLKPITRVSVTRPGTAVRELFRNPTTSGVLARAGKGGTATSKEVSPLLESFVGGKVPTATASTVSGLQGRQQAQVPQMDMGQASTTGQPIMSKEQYQALVLNDLMNNNGKNLTKLEAAYKALGGGEGGTEAQVARKAARDSTDKALQMLQTGKIKTGMIGGPLETLKGNLGIADQATLEFNTLITSIKANIAKARAGTSFTPNEEKLLDKYTPSIGDTYQELLVKLKGLKESGL